MSEKYNKQYINGVWRDGSSDTIFNNVNPRKRKKNGLPPLQTSAS